MTLEDNIWDLLKFDEQNQSLAQVHSTQQVMRFSKPGTDLADQRLISYFLRAASIKHAYKREAYSVFEYLGDLGGIFSIIVALAHWLTIKIVERLYYAAIIGSTYTIQHYDRDDSQYYTSRSVTQKLTSESTSNDDNVEEKEESKASSARVFEEEKASDNPIKLSNMPLSMSMKIKKSTLDS